VGSTPKHTDRPSVVPWLHLHQHKWARPCTQIQTIPTHEDEETQREGKHIKESEYWLHPTPTSNCYTVLLEEDNEQQQQKVCLGNMPKASNLCKWCHNYLTSHTATTANIRTTIWSSSTHKQPCQNPAKNSDSYRTIVKAQTEKWKEFHTNKLKEERSYRYC
jgi:hypothetical protein